MNYKIIFLKYKGRNFVSPDFWTSKSFLKGELNEPTPKQVDEIYILFCLFSLFSPKFLLSI